MVKKKFLMKRTAFPLVFLFCLFVTFFSCSNNSNKSRKPVSSITLLPNKKSYIIGDKVSVNVETKLKNGQIQSIKLYYNNMLLKESKDLNFTVNDIKISELGNSVFRVEATKTDSLKNTRSQAIKTVSNIEAKIYNYKVVKNYPHITTSFTQGLEWHDGYLFEGTGLQKQSHIYKTNLQTGNPVQSYKMPDKYFGEGITILNNKIYQLTYHSQKGFVYNLSDFALVDSFQFVSKEGWGLTNDGTNLIMSDGTHVLTWINPDDYSVVKKIQVANNRDVIGYLNELEYIDGIIYANIYTTEVLVQIEAESGKVLAEINCKGIMNMYKTADDTIDYMNGIAYDKSGERLFVTGKYWPRVLEIKLVPSE